MKEKLLIIAILVPIYSFSQMNSSIDFITGLEYSYRTLNYASDTTLIDLVEQRDNVENGKLNWRVGFNYNKRLSNKINFKSGIRMASVGYKGEKRTGLRWPSEIGPNGYEPDPTLPHEKQLIYDFWFIEIPIAARFEFNKKKISPFVEGGISPTIYLTTRIKEVSDINTTVRYRNGGSNNFNNFQVAGFVSLGMNYFINETIQLFTQGTFRSHFTENVDAPIAENLYNYGIEFGVRRKIN